jgi:hypothetical protein
MDPPSLNSTKEKAGPFSRDAAKLITDLGTNVVPLIESGDGDDIYVFSVSYENVSAALSLKNKVFNSI